MSATNPGLNSFAISRITESRLRTTTKNNREPVGNPGEACEVDASDS